MRHDDNRQNSLARPTPVRRPRAPLGSAANAVIRIVNQSGGRAGPMESAAPEDDSETNEGAPAAHVLVVDDEAHIRLTLTTFLEALGCKVVSVGNANDAMQMVARYPFDLLFVDVRLGSTSGLDLVPAILARRPNLQIAAMTAYPSIDSAVDAVRRGAALYVQKPFTPARIREIVDEVAKKRLAILAAAPTSESDVPQDAPEAFLQTQSVRMREVLETIVRAGASDVPVLLRGESGTGKGLLARLLHAHSPLNGGPFVTVNCPTLSEALLTSELFGHAKGSFTGAVRDQEGRVEAAENGTLFLDEIGEISPALQAKLLRFVQEKQFERVGETRTRHGNVRLVAATNRDLEKDVQDGRFREDLLFRLNVIEVWAPSLRDRREDILPLARWFLLHFSRKIRRPAPQLSPDAETALLAHSWPGNVRELRNEMERAVLLCTAHVLGPEAFARVQPRSVSAPWTGGKFTLDELEREHIRRVLEYAPTMEVAARILGIDVTTLWRKRKKLWP